MKIDEADMASATDVGRNTGRYISQATDGRRIIIMNNHQPVAAIIGMADLRRLDALDIPVSGSTPAQLPEQNVTLTDLDKRVGWIPVGLTPAGHTAYINPLEHLLVVGKGASDMIGPLLAGVVLDSHDTAFVVASEQPVVIAYPEGPPPRVVALATGLDEANDERVAEQIAGELDARRHMLREHCVNTIDQYRRFHNGSPVDHLIVVIDTADSVLGHQHRLSKMVRDIVQRGAALGASVWLFSQTATRHLIDECDAIEQRIALRTRTAIESRDIIGCADAADITAGQAILQTRPGALTPITTFTRDDSLPPKPLETIGPPIEWPSITQPPTIQQVLHLLNQSTSTSNRFQAPIGVIDDPRAHRLVPFSLEFASGAANIVRAQAPATPSTQIFLDALLASSAQLYTPDELQFHYIGPSYEHSQFSSRELPHVASVHRWGYTADLTRVITEAIDTDSGARTVLIVDDWRQFRSQEYEEEATGTGFTEVIHRVFQMPKDTSPGVHILALCYGAPPPLDRHLLEKSLTEVYLSGMDPAWADSSARAILRRLPNSPHHAAVAQGHLVLAAV